MGSHFIAIPETTDVLETIGAATLDSDEWVPAAPEDECWRTPAVPRVDGQSRNTVELAPGDSVSQNYYLLDFGQRDCMSAGEYQFRSYEPYSVSQNGETEWQNPCGKEWALQFTLQLTER